MGGWNRMNFPLADVAVEEEFLRRAERLGFYNHLAYMRIYGSDNDVEGALRFLDDETALPDFGQALAWAKSVGNEVLVDKAYCRNVMIAANSGRYHVSNRYHLRCFEAMRGTDSLELGRVYNGVGFNYTMLREYQTAGNAYAAALQLYCRLGGAAVREAAGTFYYMGLNALAQERFAAALDYFERSMGIMGRLGIYGQRFCDLSQFYSLMALCSMYERNTTSARVYLSRAGQFLEHVDGCVLPRFGSARASVCGDLFLYHYAMGLNAMLGRDYQRALDCMEAAEEQIGAARPDQRICGGLYRRDRLELFVRTGRNGGGRGRAEAHPPGGGAGSAASGRKRRFPYPYGFEPGGNAGERNRGGRGAGDRADGQKLGKGVPVPGAEEQPAFCVQLDPDSEQRGRHWKAGPAGTDGRPV